MSALTERGTRVHKEISEGGCLDPPHFVNANCGKEDGVLMMEGSAEHYSSL